VKTSLPQIIEVSCNCGNHHKESCYPWDVPKEGNRPAKFMFNKNVDPKLIPLPHPRLIQRPVIGQVAVAEHLRPAAEAAAGENDQASARELPSE